MAMILVSSVYLATAMLVGSEQDAPSWYAEHDVNTAYGLTNASGGRLLGKATTAAEC